MIQQLAGITYSANFVKGVKDRQLKRIQGFEDIFYGPTKSIDGTDYDGLWPNTYTYLAKLALKKGTLENLKIKSLYTTQAGIAIGRLKELLEGADPKGNRPILGVRVNEKVILVDGNHRIAITWLSGKDVVPVRVYNAGKLNMFPSHQARIRANRKLLALT
jgi:hypothetical protein